MTEVNPTFVDISETTLKANFIININIPGFPTKFLSMGEKQTCASAQ